MTIVYGGKLIWKVNWTDMAKTGFLPKHYGCKVYVVPNKNTLNLKIFKRLIKERK